MTFSLFWQEILECLPVLVEEFEKYKEEKKAKGNIVCRLRKPYIHVHVMPGFA